MNEEALKYIIGQAISNVLARTKNEYATLDEIYDEVSKIKGQEIDEGVRAQVRGRLQEYCSQYDSFVGKEDFFQTKEKHSGLWKNRITGETELTPYINSIIKQYPGIDTVMLKEKLYKIVNLTPGDKALSTTRNGEMKIDQIMRNFVSHKDSHKNIKFDNIDGVYKMTYIGEDEDTIDVDLYENATQEDTVFDIVVEEDEKPENEELEDVRLTFVTNDLSPKKTKNKDGKVFIRKNDLDTWVKREKSRVKNGNMAEGLVYVAEKLRLQDLGRNDLADRVKWMSRDSGDGYGYDILSYDVNKEGKEKEVYIEVKSTSNLNDDFMMSTNELKFAKEHKDSYRLYRVAKVKSKSPICKVIEVELDSIFNFEASEFRVSLKSDE